MKNEQLPTDDLKKFGIINEDLSFSKKLNENDIQKFLNGYIIVADNDKNRATFQLVENNTRLKVTFMERDKNLSELLEAAKKEIQYSDTFSKYDMNEEKNSAQLNWSKTAFIYDKDADKVTEFDFIKNRTELTAIIMDKKDIAEINRYKNELQKLKNFLHDKIDQYPEIAKEITKDLNIVINTIKNVNSVSPDEKQAQTQAKFDVQLNVNDYDLYEDANRHREEDQEMEEEQRKTGRRR